MEFFSIFKTVNIFFIPRNAVEPVVSRLCENGDRGPRAARALRRGDGSPLGLGTRQQRSKCRRGKLQAPTSRMGDSPHQHSGLPEVRRKESEKEATSEMRDEGGMEGGMVCVWMGTESGSLPGQQIDRAVGCMREDGSKDELTEQKSRKCIMERPQ